jgi:hypothetical protein
MMKMMVWYFAIDTHKIMSALILVMFIMVLLELTQLFLKVLM